MFRGQAGELVQDKKKNQREEAFCFSSCILFVFLGYPALKGIKVPRERPVSHTDFPLQPTEARKFCVKTGVNPSVPQEVLGTEREIRKYPEAGAC